MKKIILYTLILIFGFFILSGANYSFAAKDKFGKEIEDPIKVKEKQDAISKASSLMRDRNYKEAISVLDGIIKKRPNDEQLYLMRAGIKEMSGDYEGAMEDREVLIKNNPKDVNFVMARADLNMKNGEYKKASEDYEKVLKERGEEDFLYMQLAKANFKLENCKKAMDYLDKVKEYESNSEYYFLKGRCSFNKGDMEAATENFIKSERLGHPMANNYLKELLGEDYQIGVDSNETENDLPDKTSKDVNGSTQLKANDMSGRDKK